MSCLNGTVAVSSQAILLGKFYLALRGTAMPPGEWPPLILFGTPRHTKKGGAKRNKVAATSNWIAQVSKRSVREALSRLSPISQRKGKKVKGRTAPWRLW
jgi:hypothetical protein